MPLSVLNNIAALNAENNLNNTSSDLNSTLQQLSSGSKINSGADDAAGLSLINDLQANRQSLAQSQVNAQEGVGLLSVADGALTQVTSMLNRAVTLATEASNGTLNSTQDAAANQEYQSILSEVTNVGSTTTFNGKQVFNSQTNIYTGDSSVAGASIDDLSIQSLSSSGLGDTGGAISYTTTAVSNATTSTDGVFVDLSNAGTLALDTDSLGASSATTTLNVSYQTTGDDGTLTPESKAITVGNGTAYGNNVSGLIGAINDAGLGLTATFTTAAAAGSAAVAAAQASDLGGGGGADTGIEITGANVGAAGIGADGAGVVGALSVTASGDTLGGSLSIVDSSGGTHTIQLGNPSTTDTIQDLASTIGEAGYGITTTLSNNNTTLTFTSASSTASVTGTSITDETGIASQTTGLSITPSTSLGSLTVNTSSDTLTGGTLSGVRADGSTLWSLTLNGQSLSAVATTLAGYGITSITSNSGRTLTFSATNGDSGTPTLVGSGIIDTTPGSNAIAVAGSSLGSLTVVNANDTLTAGTLSGVGADGSTAWSIDLATSNQTLSELTDSLASYGISSTLSNGGTTLTFNAVGTDTGTPTITGSGITDTTAGNSSQSIAVSGATLGTWTINSATDTVTGDLWGDSSTGASIDAQFDPPTTLSAIVSAFNTGEYAGNGITAGLSGDQKTLTFTAANGDANLPNIEGELDDNAPTSNMISVANSELGVLTVNNASDTLGGTLSGLQSDGGSTWSLSLSGLTLAGVQSAVNSYGITANLSDNNTQLIFTATSGTPTISGSNLSDIATSTATRSVSHVATLGTMTVNGSSDTLSGSTLSGVQSNGSTAWSLALTGQSLSSVETTLAGYGITSSLSGSTLSFTAASGNPTIGSSGSITDTTPTTSSTAINGTVLGSMHVTSSSDTLTSGTLSGVGANGTTGWSMNFASTNETIAQVETALASDGITATLNGSTLTFVKATADTGTPTISGSNITDSTPGTPVAATESGDGWNDLLSVSVPSSGDLISGHLQIDNGLANQYTSATVAAVSLSTFVNNFNDGAYGNNFGLSATLASSTNVTFTAEPGEDIAVDHSATTLDYAPPATTTTTGINPGTTIGALTVNNLNDTLSGTLTGIEGNGSPFSVALSSANNNNTLAKLLTAFNSGADSGYGVTANLVGNTLTFTSTSSDADMPSISGSNITDTTSSSATTTVTGTVLGSMQVLTSGDKLISGTMSGVEADGVTNWSINFANTNETIAQLTTLLAGDGITASLSGTTLTFNKTGSDTSSPSISGSNITDITPGTSVAATESGDGWNDLLSVSVPSSGDLIFGHLQINNELADQYTSATVAPVSLSTFVTNFNDGAYGSNFGLSATLASSTNVTFTAEPGEDIGVEQSATTLDSIPSSDVATPSFTAGTALGAISVNNINDTLSGTLVGMKANGTTPYSITLSAANNNNTLATLAAAFTSGAYSGYGISAGVSGTTLTFTGTGSATLGNSGSITDTTSSSVISSVAPGANFGALTVKNANDTFTGTLTGVKSNGAAFSIVLSAANNNNTISKLLTAFTSGAYSSYGITATQSGNSLSFTAPGNDGATLNSSGAITDTTYSTASTSVNTSTSLGAMAVTSGSDTLTAGTLSGVGADGQTAWSVDLADTQETISQLTTLLAGYGIVANLSGTTLSFTTKSGDTGTPTISGTGITDTSSTTSTTSVTAASPLGTLATNNPYSDTLSGSISVTDGSGNLHTITLNDTSVSDFENTLSGYGITSQDNWDNSVSFYASGGYTDPPAISGSNITDNTTNSTWSSLNSSDNLGTLTVGDANNDTLTGTLTGQQGFGASSPLSSYSIQLDGMTLAALAASFTGSGVNANLGITAALNGNSLSFSAADSGYGNDDDATIGNSGAITDTSNGSSTSTIAVTPGSTLGTMTMSSSSDTLTGSISVLDKTGQHQTVTLNKTSVTSLESTLSGYGITTGVANDVLTFSATGGDTDTPAIYGPSITENTASASTIGVTPRSVLGTLAVNNADDTFTAGSLSGVKSNGSTTWSLDLTGQTIGGLESALASDGISANLSGNTLTFTAASGTPTITGSDITDTTPLNTPVNLTNTPAASSTNSASVGSLTFNNTDTLSGSLKIGSQTININSSDNTASTLEQIIDNGSYGVKASYNSTSGVMNFTSSNSALQIDSTSLYETPSGGSAAAVTTNTANNSVSSGYYSIGISGTVKDYTTALSANGTTTYGGTGNVGITTDYTQSNSTGGIATIGYTYKAGQSLSSTDLLNQVDSRATLIKLNSAISDVSAQDGYIGSQINTLNEVSQVLGVQMQNVQSAQNAVQATDYGSATSNLAKYQILMQTGISALAQANSMQQEITKLLQQ